MAWFGGGKKRSSKQKLERVRREEKAKDARHAKYPKPVKHNKPHGWFF